MRTSSQGSLPVGWGPRGLPVSAVSGQQGQGAPQGPAVSGPQGQGDSQGPAVSGQQGPPPATLAWGGSRGLEGGAPPLDINFFNNNNVIQSKSNSGDILQELLKWRVFIPEYVFDEIIRALKYTDKFNQYGANEGIINYAIDNLFKILNNKSKRVSAQQVLDFKKSLVINSEDSFYEEEAFALNTAELQMLYDGNPELVINRALSITQEFDKILTLALNAIKVYVKMRAYKDNPATNYTFEQNCITYTDKDGKSTPYGEFTGVYGTYAVRNGDKITSFNDTTTKDLHCGLDKECSDNSGLSGGTKDVATQYNSLKFTTVGISGAGKSAVLFGGKKFEENDRTGLISRIISDVLSRTNIIGSFTDIKVKLIIGEAYGEKLSYDLNKTDFMECFILWNLGKMNLKDDEPDRTTKIRKEFNLHDKVPAVNLRTYFTLPAVKVAIDSVLDKGKEVKKIRDFYMKTEKKDPDYYNSELIYTFKQPTFDDKYLDKNFYKKFIKLECSDNEKRDFISFYKGMTQMRNTLNSELYTLYDIFTGVHKNQSDFCYEYESKVGSKSQIERASQEFTQILEMIYDKITEQRKYGDFIRCTANNPESSRSHLIFCIETDTGTEKKYFIFVDQAGNESPYYVAFDDMKKIQSRKIDEKEQDLSKLFTPTQVEYLLTKKASQHYDLSKLGVSVTKLFSYIYLHHRIYKKIDFEKKKDGMKCNTNAFFEPYDQMAETLSFLFLNDINEVVNIGVKESNLNKISYKLLEGYSRAYTTGDIEDKFKDYRESTEIKLYMKLIYYYNFILFLTRYYNRSEDDAMAQAQIFTGIQFFRAVLNLSILSSYYSFISDRDEITFMNAIISLFLNKDHLLTMSIVQGNDFYKLIHTIAEYLERYTANKKKDTFDGTRFDPSSFKFTDDQDKLGQYPNLKKNSFITYLFEEIVSITKSLNSLNPNLNLELIDLELIINYYKRPIFVPDNHSAVITASNMQQLFRGVKSDLEFDYDSSLKTTQGIVLQILSNNYKKISYKISSSPFFFHIIHYKAPPIHKEPSLLFEYVIIEPRNAYNMHMQQNYKDRYIKYNKQTGNSAGNIIVGEIDILENNNVGETLQEKKLEKESINTLKNLKLKSNIPDISGITPILTKMDEMLPKDAKLIQETSNRTILTNEALIEDLMKLLKERYGYSKNLLSLDDKELNDKLLNDYLLNGLQGFWINHSNKFHVITDAILTNYANYEKYVEYFSKWEAYYELAKQLTTTENTYNNPYLKKALKIFHSIHILLVKVDKRNIPFYDILKKIIELINIIIEFIKMVNKLAPYFQMRQDPYNNILGQFKNIDTDLKTILRKNKDELLKDISNLHLKDIIPDNLVESYDQNLSTHLRSLNESYKILIEFIKKLYEYFQSECKEILENDSSAIPLDADIEEEDDTPIVPDQSLQVLPQRPPRKLVPLVYPVIEPDDTEDQNLTQIQKTNLNNFIEILEYFATAKDNIPDEFIQYIANPPEGLANLEDIKKINYKRLMKIKLLLDALNIKDKTIINSELYNNIVSAIKIKRPKIPVEENQESENIEESTPIDTKLFEEELFDSPEEESKPNEQLRYLYDKIISSLTESSSTPIGEIIKTTTPFPVFKYDTIDLSFIKKDGDITFQNNYLSKYDIKNNLWLILLYTIHHLGANKVITKHIRTNPDPTQKSYPQEESFDIGEYFNTTTLIIRKKELNAQLELIKDHYLTNKPIEIKSARVIILAATNEDGKQGQVIQTFRAAQSLARLTGKACPTKPITPSVDEDDYGQFGGGYDEFNYLFNKSYHNYIKNLNRNYKKTLK